MNLLEVSNEKFPANLSLTGHSERCWDSGVGLVVGWIFDHFCFPDFGWDDYYRYNLVLLMFWKRNLRSVTHPGKKWTAGTPEIFTETFFKGNDLKQIFISWIPAFKLDITRWCFNATIFFKNFEPWTNHHLDGSGNPIGEQVLRIWESKQIQTNRPTSLGIESTCSYCVQGCSWFMSPLPAVHVDDWNFIQIQKVLKKDEKGRSSEPTLNPQTCWYVFYSSGS